LVVAPNGWYQPGAGGNSAPVPSYLCSNAQSTGSGITAILRNRCRRAIDAYSALVKTCGLAPQLAGNRGPNSVSPDYQPYAGHAPHVTNAQNLGIGAMLCTLPVGGTAAPGNLATPSTTCPGLLGWFTVVYNACGFTNAPGLSPTTLLAAPTGAPNVPGNFPNYFSVGPSDLTQPAVFATNYGPDQVGLFCGTPHAAGVTVGPAGVPSAWNVKGASSGPVGPAVSTFPTSRCRKAMDQFGRTASRCHMSTGTMTGPAQAGGYSDPLRLLAVGNVAAASPASPSGWNVWVPVCNS